MPSINRDITQHYIPIKEGCKPIKQKLRRLRPEWAHLVKEDIEKHIKAKFLGNGLSRMVSKGCTSAKERQKGQNLCRLQGLKQIMPKGRLPLTSYRCVIDNAATFAMYSFMDKFSGYN